MNTSTKPLRFTRPLVSGLLQWNNLAAVAAALAIAVSLYRYMDTLHSGAIVAYLLYPASIGCLALLAYTRAYVRYPEVRLLGAFFGWTLIVILLNMSRANGALSSEWFYSLCAACFLCFSLPYAFEGSERKRVVSVLALITVFLCAALCALALCWVAAGRVIEMHAGIEGALGIGGDNRLWMFCHPNSAAPICGVGVVFSVYLFFTAPYKRLRYILLLPFLLCTVALSLTDSRAGILSATLALGAEAFFILAERWFRSSRRLFRVLLSIVLAVVVMAAFYQGTVWIRQGYNAHASAGLVTPAAADGAKVNSAPNTEPSAETQPQTQAVSSRDLSDLNNFNGRTAIWAATFKGLGENPSILFTGTTPLIAGQTMTPYFPANAPRGNFHNSFVAILVSFGLPGLLLLLALVVLLFLRSVSLIVRSLFDAQTLHARLLTSILIFTLAESMMEQFLFVDGMPSVVWVWFMLAAGFTFCFRREMSATPAA